MILSVLLRPGGGHHWQARAVVTRAVGRVRRSLAGKCSRIVAQGSAPTVHVQGMVVHTGTHVESEPFSCVELSEYSDFAICVHEQGQYGFILWRRQGMPGT